MAALYGEMQGNRGETTRCGSDRIRSTLSTWGGQVRTILNRDGSFEIQTGSKYGSGRTIVTGNVDDGKRRMSFFGLRSADTGTEPATAVLTFDSPSDRDYFLRMVNGEGQ